MMISPTPMTKRLFRRLEAARTRGMLHLARSIITQPMHCRQQHISHA